MTVVTRSGNVFYPQKLRHGRARGRYCGRGHFLAYTQSVSSSSSEEAVQSLSPVRSPRVQRNFSINLKQTRNPLFQEIPQNSRGHIPLSHTMEFFPKDPFQSQHTETEQPFIRIDQETEHGDHSRQREVPRNDREKDHDTDEEYEEVEILPEHITKFCKDKNFQKVMNILLNKEKEK